MMKAEAKLQPSFLTNDAQPTFSNVGGMDFIGDDVWSLQSHLTG